MKFIISILLFLVSIVSFASGANFKYYFADSGERNSREISSTTIKPIGLNGDLTKLEKGLCFNKAVEKFINYARRNPAYFANLSTLRVKNKGTVAGAKKAVYSMDFLVSDRTITMDAPVSTTEGICF